MSETVACFLTTSRLRRKLRTCFIVGRLPKSSCVQSNPSAVILGPSEGSKSDSSARLWWTSENLGLCESLSESSFFESRSESSFFEESLFESSFFESRSESSFFKESLFESSFFKSRSESCFFEESRSESSFSESLSGPYLYSKNFV
ncbi:hypothetical protein ACP275_14G185700 [Erythranthe tilingii]